MKTHKHIIGIFLIVLTLAHSLMSAAANLWVAQEPDSFTLQLCTGNGVITAPLSVNDVNQVFKGQINQDLINDLTLNELKEDSSSHHFNSKHCPLCYFNQQNIQAPSITVIEQKPLTLSLLTIILPHAGESIYVDSPFNKFPPKRGPPHFSAAA